MKTFTSGRFMFTRISHLIAALLLCGRLSSVSAALPTAGTNEDFSAVSRVVVELLQTRDTGRFATNLSPSLEDWQFMLTTNTAAEDAETMADYRQTADHNRQKIEQAAQLLLAKADSLHVNFTNATLHAAVVPPLYIGTLRYTGGTELPFAGNVEINLTASVGINESTRSNFKLIVRDLEKCRSGWRTSEGIQWNAFPTNIADAGTLREMAILEKVAAFTGMSNQDDPALLKLGDALVHFIRTRDLGVYTNEVYVTPGLEWTTYPESDRTETNRSDMMEFLNSKAPTQLGMAHATLQLMKDAGLDFSHADIRITEASVDRMQSRLTGSLLGLEARKFKLKLTVNTDAKSKNGTPLSGDYVLGARTVMRFADEWRIEDFVHWEQVPAGILSAEAASKIEYENYVADHGALPPGSTVPEIEFTTLNGEKKMKLSDLRGKIVVLDFWARWCGACQEPMANLQEIRVKHPGWQDKVVLMPLSIDDTIKEIRDYVDQKGWTNTFNVWAGDGGWESKPALTFRLEGVPTMYLINAQGKIIGADHYMEDIGREIDELLAKDKSAKP